MLGMGTRTKKVILIIQILLALLVLIAAIGGIVAGVIGVKDFAGLDTVDSSEGLEEMDGVGDMFSGVLSVMLFGGVLFFSGFFTLLSAFMLLDALYKWPSKKE